MAIRKIITNRNAIVVKKLRMQKLKAGFPFMINMKELDTSQCYLEYPNGSIKLGRRDFRVCDDQKLIFSPVKYDQVNVSFQQKLNDG